MEIKATKGYIWPRQHGNAVFYQIMTFFCLLSGGGDGEEGKM